MSIKKLWLKPGKGNYGVGNPPITVADLYDSNQHEAILIYHFEAMNSSMLNAKYTLEHHPIGTMLINTHILHPCIYIRLSGTAWGKTLITEI